MKLILATISAVLMLFACSHEGFDIKGEIKDSRGITDNARITLTMFNNGTEEVLGTSEISDGKFRITGNTVPGRVFATIDANSPDEEIDYRKIYKFQFYIDNSKIDMKIDMDNVSEIGYEAYIVPEVKGSATHDLYNEFSDNISKYTEEERALDKRYRDEYIMPSIKGQENMEECIPIASSLVKVRKNILQVKEQFILTHASSVVALELFSDMMNGMYVVNTAEMLDKMCAALKQYWGEDERFTYLAERAEKMKKLAMGEKFLDIELSNLKGESVNLASVVPSGKYVLLEFWASWCGPCRGEIPHLKKAYSKYAGKDFEIVSISLDEKESDWLKAIKEENMSWTQLRDSKGLNGPVVNTYLVTGVPFCLILDREGHIVETDSRGAFLDVFLENNI